MIINIDKPRDESFYSIRDFQLKPHDTDCKHEFKRWTGKIPCTGKYVCSTCGKDFTNERYTNVN